MVFNLGASSVLTPSGQNLAGMRRYILNYVQGVDDDDLIDLATDAINMGIDMLNSKAWNWSVKNQDITLAADDDDYSLNADFKKPFKLLKLNSDGRRIGWLNWSDPKVFLDEHPRSQPNASPQYYTVVNSTDSNLLLLNHKPSSGYVGAFPTLRLYYYSRISHLQNAGDVLDAPPEVWAFLGWYGRYDIATVRAEQALADRAFSQYQLQWRQLVADDEDTMTDYEMVG